MNVSEIQKSKRIISVGPEPSGRSIYGKMLTR